MMRLSTCMLATHRLSEEESGQTVLEAAGYIKKTAIGCYAFLPLGQKFLQKIYSYIHQSMEGGGYWEVHLSLLQELEWWERSGRSMQFTTSLAKTQLNNGTFVLNASQEEALHALIDSLGLSAKSFPLRVGQVSERIRNEVRPAHGLVRGLTFHLAEWYSFALNSDQYAGEIANLTSSMENFFKKLGISIRKATWFNDEHKISLYARSHGQAKQCQVAECFACEHAFRGLTEGCCPQCGHPLEIIDAIEMGDIVVAGDRFSRLMNIKLLDQRYLLMVFGGIGVSRLIQILAEEYRDKNGLVWPQHLSPFDMHLIASKHREIEAIELANSLEASGKSVLLDDRDISIGRKLIDADLIGISLRILLGDKSAGLVESKFRSETISTTISASELVSYYSKK